jgi:hypothetical protein
VRPEVPQPGTERAQLRARSLEEVLRQLLRAPRRGFDAGVQHVDERAVLVDVANRVELEHRRLLLGIAVDEAHVQPLPRVSAANLEALGRLPVLGSRLLLDTVAHGVQPDEVGVRVEHDDPQRRSQQQLFEHGSERVRLARPRLAAEERVPVESARVKEEAQPGLEHELADIERGARRATALEPGRDVGLCRRRDRLPMERLRVVVEHQSCATRERDPSGRPAVGGRELDVVGRCQLHLLHLAEPAAENGVPAPAAARARARDTGRRIACRRSRRPSRRRPPRAR